MEESKKYIDKKLEDIGEEGENLKELVKALIKPSTAAPVNVTPINYSEDNSDTSQRYSFFSPDSSPFDPYGKPIKEVFA